MSETVRAKSVIKITNGILNLDWTYQKGTPAERVANDITGGKYNQLKASNKELLEALEYSSRYLDENELSSIGSGSKAHREMQKAITNAKQVKL